MPLTAELQARLAKRGLLKEKGLSEEQGSLEKQPGMLKFERG